MAKKTKDQNVDGELAYIHHCKKLTTKQRLFWLDVMRKFTLATIPKSKLRQIFKLRAAGVL